MGVCVLLYVGLGLFGKLPAQAPLASVLTPTMPYGPETSYPVFGSNELVTYLARSMVAQERSIDVKYWTTVKGFRVEDLNDAMLEAHVQNPYTFSDKWSFAPGTGRIEPDYLYDDTEAERRRSLVASSVKEALVASGASEASTDAERVAAIHDYVTQIATYDYEAFQEIGAGIGNSASARVVQSQQAYGILIDGTAVCNGYAQTFQLMADELGLRVVTVTGTDSAGLTGASHAWNKVWVDGAWRIVDVTWDDREGAPPSRDYLLTLDSDPILGTRTQDLDWVVDANASMYK